MTKSLLTISSKFTLNFWLLLPIVLDWAATYASCLAAARKITQELRARVQVGVLLLLNYVEYDYHKSIKKSAPKIQAIVAEGSLTFRSFLELDYETTHSLAGYLFPKKIHRQNSHFSDHPVGVLSCLFGDTPTVPAVVLLPCKNIHHLMYANCMLLGGFCLS